MKELIKQLAAEQSEAIREYRHYLHMHPELSFQETGSQAYIKEKLTEFGIEIAEGITGTSTVGIIRGEQPGKTIAFRADFDALPVTECNDLPYKSTVPGVMHACGHDTHAATLLAFGKVLSEHPELVKGTVKLIFQRAEELLPGGAKTLVEDGVMEDVDEIYGFHASAGKDLGKVIVNDGPVSAAVSTYEIVIKGKGGHGSNSAKALNPVPIAALLINAIEQIKTEKVDPSETATVTVCYMHAGDAPNIIPAEARIGGNVRVHNNELLVPLLDRIVAVAKALCEAWGAECEPDMVVGYPATINQHEQCELVREAVGELGYELGTTEAGLGGEDFAYYALEKPGCFFNVGASNPEDPGTYNPHHSPLFRIDERMLDIALECELAVYLKASARA